MSDQQLLLAGACISFIAFAGAYVFVRASWERVPQPASAPSDEAGSIPRSIEASREPLRALSPGD